MSKLRTLLFVAAVCVGLADGTAAQETGSISGAVFDSNGAPVAGATVRVSGAQLPAGRSVTTSDSGGYQFLRIVPGVYTVEASTPDLGSSKREIIVELDRDVQVDMVLGLALQETIDVTATRAAVDLRKTEVNLNYNADAIADLPLERSYRGLFQLVPGVADNRSEVGPAAGGSRQDNTYLIDGVNITNPGFGYLSTEVNALDIVEFNVKRGAVSAEFGRASGMVTNAISRSGTNRFAGQAQIEWLPQGLIGDYKDDRFTDPLLKTVVNPAIGVGGPILRDRAFFYGSARYFEMTRGDRQNRLGQALPDRIESGRELFGKITATPTARHLVNVGFRDRPNDADNTNLDAGTTAAVAYTAKNDNRVATATWAFFPTNTSTVDLKYLYLLERFEGEPVTDLGYLPPFNVGTLAAMGYYQDPGVNNVRTGGYEYFQRVQYRRHEVKGTFTQFLDIAGTSHELKAGGGYEFGEEDFFRLTNGWGDLVALTVEGQPRIRARYYFEQPPQLGQGRTWSAFIQDSMNIGRRLIVNAGVLFNRDEFAQELAGSGGCPVVALVGGAAVWESDGDVCTFIRYGFGDQVQPRLGVNYALREGRGDKLYANWGRYYSTDQKSSARSLAPRRIFQREAFYDTRTGALISDAPRASTTGKLIDPDLAPTYSDEFLLGYTTTLTAEWSLETFFQYKDFKNFIEDVPSVFPATGPYAAANLPCTRWEACRFEAFRTYKAWTTEVRGRLGEGMTATASYTWSRLEGNFDLDFNTTTATFNTSSFIQDGPGTFVQDPNREGPLLQDRPHIFKLFADYLVWENLTVGGYLRIQSGAPWAARGPDTQSSSNLNYLEPAGSRRNPAWANLDLLGAYRLRLNGQAALTLEARLLNAIGNQTRLSTDVRQFLTLNRISAPPFIGPYTDPNPLFGTADQYAPPRRLVVAARLAF
jgi:hypothetical protein